MAMQNGGSSEKLLGKRIQLFRREAGLTQQQLCNQANISYSTLTKIERGAIKSPSIFTVESIASAIGVGLDKIIGRENSDQHGRQFKKSASGIRFVYFDVNGCLVRFYQGAIVKIAADYELPADVVETAFWHYNDEACRGKMSLTEFNTKLAAKLGIKSVRWQDYYLETVKKVPKTKEMVEAVQRFYRVGLMTNIMPGLLNDLRESGKVPAIDYDAVVDSSEVGHIKPEPKIYQVAESKAGVIPSEILLIDDTRANLSAAEKAGWHVLWFDYARPLESVERILKTLEVGK